MYGMGGFAIKNLKRKLFARGRKKAQCKTNYDKEYATLFCASKLCWKMTKYHETKLYASDYGISRSLAMQEM